MKLVTSDDPRPDFVEGDVSTLVCPKCGQTIHITEFGPGGEPLPDENGAEISEYVAAHFDAFHPIRFHFIRWLSFGWLP
jgi:hypothetical protein